MQNEWMEKINRVAELVKNQGCVKAGVTLHLHYDKDEEYDYTGMHNVSIYVYKTDKLCNVITIDLDDVSVEDCKKAHLNIFEEVKKFYPQVTKKEIVHRDDNR